MGNEWMEIPKKREELPLMLIASLDSRLLKRYHNEPVFYALVNVIESGLRSKKFTTGDLSQAMEVAIEKINGMEP